MINDVAAKLKVEDRCDRCGARACVKSVLGGGELLWCSHHWNEHGAAVRARPGVRVVDDRPEVPA